MHAVSQEHVPGIELSPMAGPVKLGSDTRSKLTRDMNMFQLWIYDEHPPWKFFVHLLLLLTVTGYVLFRVNQDRGYGLAMTLYLQNALLPGGFNSSNAFMLNFDPVPSVTQAVQVVSGAVEAYYKMPSRSVFRLDHLHTFFPEVPLEPDLVLDSYDSAALAVYLQSLGLPTNTTRFPLSRNSTVPINFTDPSASLSLFYAVSRFSVHFRLRSVELGRYFPLCWAYEPTLHYSAVDRVTGSFSLDILSGNCQHSDPWYKQSVFAMTLLCMLIFGLSCSSCLLTLGEFWSSIKRGTSLLATVLQPFMILSLIGDMANILFSLTVVVGGWLSLDILTHQHEMLGASSRILAAIGSVCAWLNMCQYMSFFRPLNIMWKTIHFAAGDLGRFSVALSIVTMAFIALGMQLFHYNTFEFCSFGNTLRTLFYTANGDTVHDTFNSVKAYGSQFLGFTYMYTMMVLYTCVGLKLFIEILKDGYVDAQQERDQDLREEIALEHDERIQERSEELAQGFERVRDEEEEEELAEEVRQREKEIGTPLYLRRCLGSSYSYDDGECDRRDVHAAAVAELRLHLAGLHDEYCAMLHEALATAFPS
eukprot:gnl/Spiro4/14720_TR7928_c0_g1_i1.p1 gnl/Spiro4/14720_TR7928_c0_g1~~gnl/Spiro4/14720_TR7928_c0_g1_i1.p1  ORF type:complete len:590 (-),score=122.32 gnl/Spiro4/14720_TR7928_c0_g1_i1:64-1833(-)